MTWKDFCKKYVYVHKCGGCGEILSPARSDGAFCEKCELEWRAELNVGCSDCFLPIRECGCMPKSMSRAGALTLRKLFFYRADTPYTASMSMIYWIKHRKSKRMVRFICDALSVPALEEMRTLGVDVGSENFLITYVPRGKRSYREHGFDQSRLVAKGLSQMLGICFSDVFYTRLAGKQQKKLDNRARMRNARESIRMKNTSLVKGKYILLFDDIVTSGASMAVCVQQLIKAGARGVVCLCMASRPSNKVKK